MMRARSKTIAADVIYNLDNQQRVGLILLGFVEEFLEDLAKNFERRLHLRFLSCEGSTQEVNSL